MFINLNPNQLIMNGEELKKKRDNFNLTQDELAKMIGVSRKTINTYENSSDIPISKQKLFVSVFDELSNKMLQEDVSSNKLNPTLIKSDYGSGSGRNGVPYYEDIEGTASIVSSYSDFKEMPTFYIDYEHFNDCTAYVPIVGDSMYPSFCSGEIIAIKKVFNLDVILWGEAYFVVTNGNANDIKAAKLLFPHEEESKITLRSSNPNYKGDTVINKIDILHLYLIKGKIHRKHL